MAETLILAGTVGFYLTAVGLLLHRLRKAIAPAPSRVPALVCMAAGLALHTLLLQTALIRPDGLSLGFFNAASLIGWQIVLVLLLASLRLPVENLGIPLLPLAALGAGVSRLFPNPQTGIETVGRPWLDLHIVLSILAFSLLAMAVAQSAVLAIQDRFLRRHNPVALTRVLPSIQTMEELLFQMVALGFLLLSLALFSGMLFVNDFFAQHLIHKTVLSIIAWLIFGLLLWGRWRYGWRGRVATRWTMGGGVALTLAYFGSKLVLEVMLGRQWG